MICLTEKNERKESERRKKKKQKINEKKREANENKIEIYLPEKRKKDKKRK